MGADLPPLSPRQFDCLRLAAQGLTSPQIGIALGMSPRTVNQRIRESCARLGVRNRTQAVAKLVALGQLAIVPSAN